MSYTRLRLASSSSFSTSTLCRARCMIAFSRLRISCFASSSPAAAISCIVRIASSSLSKPIACKRCGVADLVVVLMVDDEDEADNDAVSDGGDVDPLAAATGFAVAFPASDIALAC